MTQSNHYNAIVIGAGPAGLSAGIYLSRARVKTLILNEGTVGGQMVLTHEVANYPGVESMSGYQLAVAMRNQAKKFGCDIKANINIAGLDLKGMLKTVTLSDGVSFTADTVILSPGGRSRTLGVPGEEALKGKGISYCATCDGDFFTDKEIIVVGGGNSALEEAVSLTKYASKVTIVHQFDHFQAFDFAVEEARNHPKINFMMESAVTAFHGSEKLQGVEITDLKTGTKQNHPIDGVFIFIGYMANTEFLDGKIDLNKWKEIVVDADMQTSIEGVFAAGDSIAKRYRQITTAVADGTIAALSASKYIHENQSKFTEIQTTI
jgi:thioredoxin reductase (NADPH)